MGLFGNIGLGFLETACYGDSACQERRDVGLDTQRVQNEMARAQIQALNKPQEKPSNVGTVVIVSSVVLVVVIIVVVVILKMRK